MANYYSDHPEIGFYLNHPLMARIVELKEKGFADAKEFDYAPVDLGDAIENYKQILDITGDVAANIIAPNSEDVDLAFFISCKSNSGIHSLIYLSRSVILSNFS